MSDANLTPVVSPCEVCNAPVSELRRGRCWGCYARWVEARPVGIGAKCVTCPEKRRRVLKAVELYGGWKPMCFNCAGQVLHLDPIPATIAELKAIVSRERRDLDRRIGKPDSRVFQYERRVGDRRMPRSVEMSIEDDMIIEITIEPEPTSTGDADVDFESDLTAIRSLITELRPLEMVG
jgi:hypothetical protein